MQIKILLNFDSRLRSEAAEGPGAEQLHVQQVLQRDQPPGQAVAERGGLQEATGHRQQPQEHVL